MLYLRNSMQKYIAAATIILLITMVITRVLVLKKQGIQAMQFGAIDKKDFIIPPFAFFYFHYSIYPYADLAIHSRQGNIL